MYEQVETPVRVVSKPAPKWASWDYAQPHLPAAFHKSTGPFEAFMKWLQTDPYRSPDFHPYSKQKALVTCLGIGLVMRDLQCMQFVEEGQRGLDPVLQSSKLSWPHFEGLVTRCSNIEKDLKICLENIPGEILAEISKCTSDVDDHR